MESNKNLSDVVQEQWQIVFHALSYVYLHVYWNKIDECENLGIFSEDDIQYIYGVKAWKCLPGLDAWIQYS